MSFRHGIARSIGAALGLFAIVMATLLVPVHQAHAAQRDLARASGDLLGVQVICHGDPLGTQADGAEESDPTADGRSVVKCPVCSLAKQVGSTPSPTFAGMLAKWDTHTPILIGAVVIDAVTPEHSAQPRAPPMPV